MLKEPDVHALIELLGAVAALPVDLAEKKRRLLGEVCQMIGGDSWRWTLRGKTKAKGGSADHGTAMLCACAVATAIAPAMTGVRIHRMS